MKKSQVVLLSSIFFLFAQVSFAQWTNLGSGIDESPRTIWSIAVPNENTVWAFAVDANNFLNPVFEFTRTTDGGDTWQTGIYDIDSTLLVGAAFALDSLTLWLCSTDLGNPVSGNLYKTIDGGISWTHQNTAYNGFNEVPVAVHFFDENVGVTFGAQFNDDFDDQISIYTTTDGGNMWNKVLTPNIPPQLSGEGMTDRLGNGIYSAFGNSIWFPTTFGRIFKSKDKGLTWEVFETGLQGLPPQDPISIAMQDSLVGILISDNPNEAVKTTNGGETWEFIDLPSSTMQAFQIKYIPETEGTYLIHDGFDDQSTKAFLTHDSGTTWEIIETNISLFCSEFLSSSVGYGGGDIIDSEIGGIYKWEGDELISTEIISNSTGKIKLYPNPASNFLSLTFPQNINPERVTIRDFSGRIFNSQEVQYGNSVLSINIENLPSGIYNLDVITRSGLLSTKFTKTGY